jgi:hypothetical protein
MKAVFSVGGDGEFPQPSYDIVVCFNGIPDTVILEVVQTTFDAPGEPTTTGTKCLMRTALRGSHARAIASALLSAATEIKKRA